MNQSLALMISAIIAGAVALTTALLTAHFQIKRFKVEQQVETERDREKRRIQYLDPLRLAAQDLIDKISNLSNSLKEKNDFWREAFQEVKNTDRDNKVKFAFWCNGAGAGAVTALYVTVVYFAFARKIRADMPYIKLGPKDDKNLLSYLTKVREAFGGEYNLWSEIQDSVGSYVTNPDGTIMNYKGFCTQLIDKWDHIWFTRLIDFFRDIHMKQKEIPRILESLNELVSFITKASEPSTK